MTTQTLVEKVRTAWRKILEVDEIRESDNFFELGGSSAEATLLGDEIAWSTGRRAVATAIFEHPILESYAGYVETCALLDEEDSARRREPVDGGTSWYPLTDVQELLWREAKKSGFASTHNIAAYLELKGTLDLAALRASLEDVIRRHDALRMIFDRDEPWQRPHPQPRLELETSEGGRSVDELEPEIRTFVTRPIDLVKGPPLRAVLYRLSGQHHLLVISLSHFVADGWSRGLLVRDLGAFYRHRVEGTPLALAPIAMSFGDHARFENRTAVRRLMKQQREHRIEQLGDRDGGYKLRSAGRIARPHHFVSVTRTLDHERLEALRRIAHGERCSLTMVFLGLVEKLLGGLSDEPEFLISMPVLNQFHPGARETMGMFSNNVIVNSHVEPGDSWRTHLGRVRREMLAALEHRHAPFRFLEKAIPGVNVLFNMLPAENMAFQVAGLEAQPLPVPRTRNRFSLSFRLEPVREGMLLDIGYLEGYVTPAEVGAMFARVDDLITELRAELGPPPADETVEGRIEAHLAQHPAIQDSVVFEWPDAARGKIHVAYVISSTALTLEDLRAHCLPHLPPDRVPAMLVLTPGPFPEGRTRVVLRAAARERFRRTLERRKA